jgi:hypothetical protein
MANSQIPSFVSRQCVVVVVLLIALLFFILALAFSWYQITEENVPYPEWHGNSTATVVSTFYWTGVSVTINTTASAHDPLGTSTKKKLAWGEFPTGAVEAKFLTSMALLIASLGLDLVLIGMVLFAQGVFNQKFGSKTKWLLFAVSLAMAICSFLSWFLFFGLCESFALDESYCPDEAYLGLSVFDQEKYWCTTFLGERNNVGTFKTHFHWGPLRSAPPPPIYDCFTNIFIIFKIYFKYYINALCPGPQWVGAGDREHHRLHRRLLLSVPAQATRR